MSGTLALVIAILLCLACSSIVFGISSFRAGKLRFASSGSLLIIAAFCAYGFIASGEYTGSKELYFKSAYGLVGGLCVVAALWLAINRQHK